MTIRTYAGLALVLIGGWLFWGGLSAVIMITSRGSGLADALFEPPTSLIRLLSTALVVIGGLLAATSRKGGALVAGTGTFLFLLLPVLMAASGAASKLWIDEAAFAGVMAALVIALFVFKRGKA
ncbi:hypothetical protein [Hyphomonas johnsonii]|jgi:hypothetical protein|uniref:Uncharacterized protein n=1 Tax=Hyphomonas johnsonii MHS-2 TaxID=1280950 RepID=A0A059FPK7_9PROT|nr:hypothetical protein [Hyphomonas johnsonii]KCZ92413.1 hypothetical protein HJO_10269 [Hyphomonas johnsonii MHS-2]